MIEITMCLDATRNGLQRSQEKVRSFRKAGEVWIRDYLKKNEALFLLKIPDILHQKTVFMNQKEKGRRNKHGF